MKRPPPPLQFLGGIMALWIAGRIVALGVFSPAGIAPSALAGLEAPPVVVVVPRASDGYPVVRRIGSADAPRGVLVTPLLLARAGPVPPQRAAPLPEAAPEEVRAPAASLWPGFGESLRPAPAARAPASRSRWSGDAYLFTRSGGGAPSLASGGMLGGSQAAVRLAYALNRDGPPRLAIAARAYVPLGEVSGSEGAVGIDWHPLPKAAFRLSAERRFDMGGTGRSAWSAYAAGGVYKNNLPGGMEADLYAQAGVVGARRSALFVDGVLHVARPLPLGPRHVLRVGVAAWGAAQPDAARLDVGPRVALGFPLGATNITAALDYRARIHGDAAPRSGFAFTLAAGF